MTTGKIRRMHAQIFDGFSVVFFQTIANLRSVILLIHVHSVLTERHWRVAGYFQSGLPRACVFRVGRSSIHPSMEIGTPFVSFWLLEGFCILYYQLITRRLLSEPEVTGASSNRR